METIFSADTIQRRIAGLALEIGSFYRGRSPLTVITMLNGGMFFAADLVRRLDLPEMWMDSIAAASYANDCSTGKLRYRSTLKLSPAGRDVLILDDVLDTGVTLAAVKQELIRQGALTVRVAVMIEKDLPRGTGLAHADWCGFIAPNRYLVGYGMDTDEKLRQLPFIAAL